MVGGGWQGQEVWLLWLLVTPSIGEHDCHQAGDGFVLRVLAALAEDMGSIYSTHISHLKDR